MKIFSSKSISPEMTIKLITLLTRPTFPKGLVGCMKYKNYIDEASVDRLRDEGLHHQRTHTI